MISVVVFIFCWFLHMPAGSGESGPSPDRVRTQSGLGENVYVLLACLQYKKASAQIQNPTLQVHDFSFSLVFTYLGMHW